MLGMHGAILRISILSASVSSLALAATPAVAQQIRTFDIPAQPLSSALLEFSRQSDVMVVVAPGVTEGKRSPALRGAMPVDQAIGYLLRGSRLRAEPNSAGGYIVRAERDAPAAVPPAATDAPSAGKEAGSGQEILVTGTRLRIGQKNATSPMLIINRDRIEKEGLATAADIVRSIPQNFSSTNAANTTTTPGLATTPFGSLGVSTANLFGLGSNATLVLVNGHRLAGAPSFRNDGTVDLSTIPAEAIERVEIVMDGASAIYGSDAIGGVINFILRKDYSGIGLTARADRAANEGNSWNVGGTVGKVWSTGNVLVTAEYRHASPLNARKAGWTTTDLRSRGGSDWRDTTFTVPGTVEGFGALPASFTGLENWTVADLSYDNLVPYDFAKNQDGSPRTNAHSVTVNFSQSIGSRVTATLDGFYTREKNSATQGYISDFIFVPATNPFNHVGEDVFVVTTIPTADNHNSTEARRINVNGALLIDVVKDWRLTLSTTYGQDKSTLTVTGLDPSIGETVNLFGNGSAIGDVSKFLSDLDLDTKVTTHSYDAFVDGTLFTAPGGPVKLGFGGQRRKEDLDRGAPLPNTNGQSIFGQVSTAAFFEAAAPLVGDNNRLPGIESLQLSLAGRYDRYEFAGFFNGEGAPKEKRSYHQFSPRIGLLFRPAEPVAVRASWGKSFRAPAVLQLASPLNVQRSRVPVRDPESGEIVFARFGTAGNSNLGPETSTTQSIGIEWTPKNSGLRLGATYTRFHWTDRISVGKASDPALWPVLNLLPDLIPRDLPPELGGDGDPTTIDAALNAPINIAQRDVKVLNGTAQYSWDIKDIGQFNAGISGVFTLKAQDVIIPGAPVIQNLARSQGPDRTVIRASLGWTRGNYGLNLYGHFSSSYKNTFNFLYRGLENTGRIHVKSYTTFDLTGFYNFRHFKIHAGVKDIFNPRFPFYDSAGGPYDPSRVDPRGRTFFVQVRSDLKL